MSAIARDLRKLVQLLDEERAALRISDMDRIASLNQKKLALLDRIEDCPPSALTGEDAPLGARIAETAGRNQKLIAAALDGLRDAQSLVARARLPRRHETYARDGARQKIDSPPGTLERRA